MTNTALHQFMEEIIAIQPGMAGLGSASAAIIGTTGSEGVVSDKLRADALAFANEYSQSSPDKERLTSLATALEGSLLAVKLVSGVSDAKLEKLIAELHTYADEKQ